MSRYILILLMISGLMISLNIRPLFSKVLFGLPIILSGILGVVGTYFIIRGMHEPVNEKKIVALTVNIAMVILTFAIVISNAIF